ncbi:TIGR02757 family protein [Flavobacterium sp.]|uniref:TIGR02757 family protein n=1 Tax=Flavobacterium sp. TaxID=239 RepID=UPI0028BDD28F|nr:TIGR02757 family protein [Flavobacterium sp.]
MDFTELKDFLDKKVELYNHPNFIESDPIQIPHQFSLKEDIEISGFLASVIAWGNRKMIIKNAQKQVELLGNSPYDFVMCHSESDLEKLESFVHRTFNGQDFIGFIKSLRNIYQNHNGLEAVFAKNQDSDSMQRSISEFKKIFFEINHLSRTEKHLPNPLSGSAAKRINMYLRWMCRQDNKGVDFGIWKTISSYKLSCPLDVHSGNVARKLELLSRKQNDSKALAELDANLRKLDTNDPVKYDFALFGLGVFEGF